MVQSKCHTLLSHWPNTDHPIFRSSDHDRKDMKRVRGQRFGPNYGSFLGHFGSSWVKLMVKSVHIWLKWAFMGQIAFISGRVRVKSRQVWIKLGLFLFNSDDVVRFWSGLVSVRTDLVLVGTGSG